MPAFPVILYPDPRLKMACESVGVVDDAVRQLIQDLLDTMDAGPPRTVGIAAPQIGAMTRVAIVDIGRNPKHEGLGHGYLALVNPTIVAHTGEQIGREGCLSLPDYTANIRRWERITVEALDPNGAPVRIESEGFEAVVLQHEIDHLDGILFLDRVANVKTDLFQRRKK
ncbi:peptide deformylase [Capsulimonas corticalis]|uniref:Peptide deformylase n=1 Tax=Capsulimonas corticalis TaxID=2219043 RepID=A0A402CU35_9BACT|nr:peptide deformylase [Capsulimonas corticalis]BDI28825.1 peptide deformylase [Capsulimonas corticalis]